MSEVFYHYGMENRKLCKQKNHENILTDPSEGSVVSTELLQEYQLNQDWSHIFDRLRCLWTQVGSYKSTWHVRESIISFCFLICDGKYNLLLVVYFIKETFVLLCKVCSIVFFRVEVWSKLDPYISFLVRIPHN